MKKLLFAILVCYTTISSFAFDFSSIQSLLSKDYKSIEECQNISPKVNYQREFVELICSNLFQPNKEPSKPAKSRLLCLRKNIENASTIEASRRVIFDCLEKYPMNDKGIGLRLAQQYFKTHEEFIQEQLQEQARRNLFRNSPPPLILFDML